MKRYTCSHCGKIHNVCGSGHDKPLQKVMCPHCSKAGSCTVEDRNPADGVYFEIECVDGEVITTPELFDGSDDSESLYFPNPTGRDIRLKRVRTVSPDGTCYGYLPCDVWYFAVDTLNLFRSKTGLVQPGIREFQSGREDDGVQFTCDISPPEFIVTVRHPSRTTRIFRESWQWAHEPRYGIDVEDYDKMEEVTERLIQRIRAEA